MHISRDPLRMRAHPRFISFLQYGNGVVYILSGLAAAPGSGVNMMFTCRKSRILIVLRGKLPALGLSRDVNARNL